MVKKILGNDQSQLECILIVEDEQALVQLLAEYLREHHYRVLTASNAAEARLVFQQEPIDLALLDIRLPGEDGLSLARWVSDQFQRTGIVMLTSEIELTDRILGLEMGADDYICKPFDMRELLARIKSVLRRRCAEREAVAHNNRVAFGSCSLDLDSGTLYDETNQELSITAKELELLRIFAARPNKVLTRDQLMQLAHNKEWDVYDRSLDLRIMRLRKKIELNPNKPMIIKTVRGLGYVFIP